jgi:hypothetical protein
LGWKLRRKLPKQVVPQPGFEPGTFCLEGRRSIR